MKKRRGSCLAKSPPSYQATSAVRSLWERTFRTLVFALLDLVGDSLGHTLVVIELHGEGSAALGTGAQVGGVTEHGGQGHLGAHALGTAGAGFHALHAAAAAVEVAHHVAEVFFRPSAWRP